MRSNYRLYILDELYYFLDLMNFHDGVPLRWLQMHMIHKNGYKETMASKPSSLLLICSKVNWVD
jgi:hypothetical protein